MNLNSTFVVVENTYSFIMDRKKSYKLKGMLADNLSDHFTMNTY